MIEMEQNKLAATGLRSPHKSRNAFPLVPKLVFLASLSLYVASAPVAANTAVQLPAAPGLDIDFRCEDGEGPCPLIDGGEGGNTGTIDFGGGGKYLHFRAVDVAEACPYSPVLENIAEGIGISCDGLDDLINDTEELEIEVFQQGELDFPSSTPMLGIYLDFLESVDSGEGCFEGTSGTVVLDLAGEEVPKIIPWSSDSAEGGEGECVQFNPHSIYVGFDVPQEVFRITIQVDGNENGYGVYAAGIDQGNYIPLSPQGVPGVGDLTAIISDPELAGGTVEVAAGFPKRILDPRPHCQWDGTGFEMQPLVFDGDEFEDFNVNGVPGVEVELLVSDDGSEEFYFTIPGEACGVPRMTHMGEPVSRGTPGSAPYIDVMGIESDINPVASILELKSSGLDGTLYECQREVQSGWSGGYATLDQPFLVINSRDEGDFDEEIKYLAGVGSPEIDPVGRDIMVGCGSKRGIPRAFSYVAWNVIHATQTDMRAKVGAELQALTDTVSRLQSCVAPSFYFGQLAGWPYYINLYFDYSVDQAEGGDYYDASYYFYLTSVLVDWFKMRLELPGIKEGLEQCYASGANLDQIIQTTTPAPGDRPLNAYGDLVSQVDHLAYALKSFRDLLSDD